MLDWNMKIFRKRTSRDKSTRKGEEEKFLTSHRMGFQKIFLSKISSGV